MSGTPPTDAATARRMKSVRRVGTAVEQSIAILLEQAGVRFSRDVALPETGSRSRPDFVIRDSKLAVFIDGCFWHGCPDHASLPKRNRDWWGAKLAANVARDRAATEALRSAGWTVIRAWACQQPEAVVREVLRAHEQVVRDS